ncbi:methyl-accepting chemotaxis protein [Methylotenera sp. N17]|uniref:methyl-accepting chemotaxis protein n=1 Tax=Methylotenera sp. N17 TaxID=1502761 RepID=UPI000646C430|nr:methyl-accepting chemotaxis protein [Methylotenera sp. N17]
MLSSIVDKLASQTTSVQKLKEEVAEFRALKKEIDKARCVIEYDANGTIVSVNANALNALGYQAHELVKQAHTVLLSRAEAADAGYQTFWSQLAQGQSHTGQFKLQDKAGQEKWFQGYFAPVLDAQGKLMKAVAYLTDVTESQFHTQMLQAGEAALNETFGVMECDFNGIVLDCNAQFLGPLGYSKDEVIGKNITMILDPGTAQSANYKALWEKLNKGLSETRQIKRIAKDLKEYWFQSTYVPVQGSHVPTPKVIIYSYCITAEKMKNADYEGQLSAIGRTQAIIEFDLKGNILKANDNFSKAMGYSLDEVVGKHHSQFVEESYKNSQEYKTFWEKLAKGEANAGVFKRITKSGKDVWLQAVYNPILNLDGQPFKVVKYATDVTKYKLLDADNAGQLASINRALASIEFTMDGHVTKVNQNFLDTVGYQESEVIGKHHSMFVEPTYRGSAEYTHFWQKLNTGEFEAGQFKRVDKSGQDIWLQASYNPILDMNGKPFKVVKFAIDITEQHKATDVLQAAVEETQHVIESAKAGDLTSRVPLEGKSGAIASLCDGVNSLMDKMTEVLLSVREAGETINTAAGEISTGNNDLSQRTEQQASSLEETASSMEQLSSTVKQNAENAKQANQLAAAASGVAVKGGEVVGNVVTTMSAINESARKIEDIISVIDGIAFQTNILALNAAVEAARAGEQGRGFAVVAGEVRNLAQRSASAAKEIKELISNSVSKVEEGTRLVENAGNTMTEIVSSVQRVTDIMGEISAASSEQSAGIDQVNNAITSMDEVTQQNAALVEEAAAAAESLVDQAVSLMDVVSSFKLQGAAQHERRSHSSPMRSAPKPVATARPVARPAPAKVSMKTGTDDGDWEEF